MAGKTLYDKLWDAHVVRVEPDGTTLIYIDRHLVHEVTSPQAFTGHHQFRGQAIYSSVSFGGGGAVGSLYSGYMWASAGPTLTFAVAALLSLGSFLIAWRLLREHV